MSDLLTYGLGHNQRLLTYGLGSAYILYYRGVKCVDRVMSGDPYVDWQYTVGDSKYSSPARRSIRLIQGKKQTVYYFEPSDVLIDDIRNFIKPMYRKYCVSALFLAFCDYTMKAFQALDQGNVDEFYANLDELENVLNRLLAEFALPNYEIRYTINGNHENRCYEVILTITYKHVVAKPKYIFNLLTLGYGKNQKILTHGLGKSTL